MNTEFKEGDEVVCVEYRELEDGRNIIEGKRYVIEKIMVDHVRVRGNTGIWWSGRFKLVEQKVEERPMFKIGDKVIRTGNLGHVFEEDKIYTIEDIDENGDLGIKIPIINDNEVVYWDKRYFKPAIVEDEKINNFFNKYI